MFDIGFTEMMVIGVVALLVIGPERLPAVARTTGKWVGKIRRFVTDVKKDIDKELQAEDLRQAIEKDASLDELKKIIEDSRYIIEDEETPKQDYAVKAIPDEEKEKRDKEYDEWEDDIDYGLTDHTDYASDSEAQQEKPEEQNEDIAQSSDETEHEDDRNQVK